ncbi:MAG: radical SAM protein [Proteobacteria bacterium]|nr:radical SAM protein [Pseudomonadota bacterium]
MDNHTQGELKQSLICNICEQGCLLGKGKSGVCGLYELQGRQITEILPDRYLTVCPISIETMPMLHYFPGNKFLQISSTGCNFDCSGCISTVIVREMPNNSKALLHLTPEQIVKKAKSSGCMGIAFLMNDPLASFPTFLRVAALAKANGLKVGCSSNAYFTLQSLKSLLPVLDFINIGLKGFFDESYHFCGAKSGMGPVFRNLSLLVDAGIHVELSVIFSRGKESELRSLADLIAGISPRIPLQLMRFISFEDSDISQEPSVRQAEDFCCQLRKRLNYVYLFNTPGTKYLNTICPDCGRMAINREFYGPMGAKLHVNKPTEFTDTKCGSCYGSLNITGSVAEQTHQEDAFQGGYPFTRALEMVEAMLIAMGVHNQYDIVRAWEHLLIPGGLLMLHHNVQHPLTYIDSVRYFGWVTGFRSQSEELARFLEDRLQKVSESLYGLSHRPGVYYAMAKPLFYINGGRMENQLVEWAGGISLNKQLPPGGRPGRSLSVEQLNELNPDIIFISAFLSNSVDDFLDECLELGLKVNVVKQKQIFVHPASGWDFGSPRWILGLLNIAKILHPGRCKYDVIAEARTFYQRFYGMEFSPKNINRSFSKPSADWRWQCSENQTAPASSKSTSTVLNLTRKLN